MNPTSPQQGIDEPDRRVCVACPNCSQGYRIVARLLGRRLVCRHCRHEWRAVEIDPSRIRPMREAKSDAPSDSGKVLSPDDRPPVAGTHSTAIDMSRAGTKLGRYKVLSVLGQGGMGVVWRGHDDALRRDVALKILNRSRGRNGTPGGLNVELFMQEARAVAKLQHPAVVSIFEVAEDQGTVFLALELMEGGTLKEYVDGKGPIRPAELFALMVGPAKALALAHRRGIIHRDVKPGNLMFDDHGHVKLMDFGLADVAQEVASERMRGKAVGSLGWVAPETARGKGTTASSDIYSFGLVMLFCLTGKAWLHADSRSKLIALHQSPPELDLSSIKGLTPRSERVLRKCLAVEQSQRFASADELAEALQLCADEDPGEKTRRRKSHASVAVIAAAFGLIIGVGAVINYFLRLNERAEEFARPTHSMTATPRPQKSEDSSPQSPVSPAPSPPASARSSAPAAPAASASHFKSIDEAKVPWPEVPELVDASKLKFIATRTARVFHTPGSECGRSIYASNLVNYDTPEQAIAAGKKPCRQCRPMGGQQADLAVAHENSE